MTAKLRYELKSENATDFPDNISGLISAGDLRGQLDDIIDSATFPEDGGAGSGGVTVDTGEPYKIIMLSNGTVKAVPVDAVVPTTPTGLTIIVALTSVKISWTAVTGAARYNIYRDGQLLGTTPSLSYRDTTIGIDHTYEYRVATVDQYDQISPRSTPVFATIALSLNHLPADVVITYWPNPVPTDGPAYVRVNGREIDVHNMAFTLGVDVGALRATDDPAMWLLTI
jgi:hypothetical protein